MSCLRFRSLCLLLVFGVAMIVLPNTADAGKLKAPIIDGQNIHAADHSFGDRDEFNKMIGLGDRHQGDHAIVSVALVDETAPPLVWVFLLCHRIS